LDYDTAFKDLLTLLEYPGNEKKVKDIIKKVGTSLYGYRHYSVQSNQFPSFARIATYIQDQESAKSILSAFSLNIFKEDNIEEIVKLQTLYGVSWLLELISFWKSEKNRSDSHTVEKDLDKVITKSLNEGVDRKIVLYLLDNQINQTIEDDKRNLGYRIPAALKNSIADRIYLLKSLLNSCDLLNDSQITQKLVSHVISNGVLYPDYDLGNMIIGSKAFKERKSLSAYFLVRDTITKRIKQELDKGIRDPEDWSIHIKLGCACDLCKTATAFLSSKTDSTKLWPLVERDRKHIINIFDRFDLPVTLSVEKKGSPYKLVMVKSDKLYKDSLKRFDELSKNYERLMGLVPGVLVEANLNQ
jgi:hypothetical protein